MSSARDLSMQCMPTGVAVQLKIVPGASRSKIMGVLGSALKIAVAAPPEDGKANTEVIELLSRALGAKPMDIRLLSGHGRPQKRVLIIGMNETELRRTIDAVLAGRSAT